MSSTTTDPPPTDVIPPPPGRSRRASTLATLLAVAAALLLVPPAVGAFSGGGDGSQLKGLRVMVPNSPGGGYDVTARAAASAAEEAGVTGAVEVFNLPGAGGTVGLRRLVNAEGDGRQLMSMGLGVVGSVYSNDSPVTLRQTTPIARLTQETEILVVPTDSPFRDLSQLVAAWRANPGALPVGGGSSPGGPDHLAPMLTAKAAGIDPRSVNYVPYDGGGDLLAAVLGGKVGLGVSGLGEFADQIASGDLRVLAVTAGQRVPGLDAPTLREAGVDVEFTNWRGIVAPPGLPGAERDELVAAVDALHASPEWREQLERNDWQDAYLPGDAFGAFLAAEDERVAGVLRELGLA
ncbi:tripartite tricarboxylate transporter substrate binding protein [Actinomycetospora sp. NBRC 106378]|uniref:Bug family tripartite tricarboxylate transporter substrate binding protein n=1 Tax=Actinomycetospora sp. NBRC 106378 TaxID=3032208 RepID=UPI0024A4B6EB|nr:tripartite tricarboxylate transporter substrate binding protein [Actinomycetospora sp. NBRC 106378]GLZ52403.1 C4-dicarboxylate ABC transporter substrate-binding protein [Actinomycetospora sp. NBRC 106378]